MVSVLWVHFRLNWQHSDEDAPIVKWPVFFFWRPPYITDATRILNVLRTVPRFVVFSPMAAFPKRDQCILAQPHAVVFFSGVAPGLPISAEGVAIMAKALETNAALTKVDLRGAGLPLFQAVFFCDGFTMRRFVRHAVPETCGVFLQKNILLNKRVVSHLLTF